MWAPFLAGALLGWAVAWIVVAFLFNIPLGYVFAVPVVLVAVLVQWRYVRDSRRVHVTRALTERERHNASDTL